MINQVFTKKLGHNYLFIKIPRYNMNCKTVNDYGLDYFYKLLLEINCCLFLKAYVKIEKIIKQKYFKNFINKFL